MLTRSLCTSYTEPPEDGRHETDDKVAFQANKKTRPAGFQAFLRSTPRPSELTLQSSTSELKHPSVVLQPRAKPSSGRGVLHSSKQAFLPRPPRTSDRPAQKQAPFFCPSPVSQRPPSAPPSNKQFRLRRPLRALVAGRRLQALSAARARAEVLVVLPPARWVVELGVDSEGPESPERRVRDPPASGALATDLSCISASFGSRRSSRVASTPPFSCSLSDEAPPLSFFLETRGGLTGR